MENSSEVEARVLASVADLLRSSPPPSADFVTALSNLAKEASASQKRTVDIKDDAATLGRVTHTIDNVASLTPRGKCSLRLGEKGAALVDSKDQTPKIAFRWDEVTRVLAVPVAEATSIADAKVGSVVLVLKAAAAAGDEEDDAAVKKRAAAAAKVAFRRLVVLNTAAAPCFLDTKAKFDVSGETFAEVLSAVVCQLTGLTTPEVFTRGLTAFQSALTKGGPSVRCNLGSSQSQLFLSKAGCFFQKPPLYLPLEEVASIATSGGATRSFDLSIEMDEQSKSFEFSNIDKEELAGLEAFIRDVMLPARRAKSEKNDEADDDEDDEDSEEDDDFVDPDASSDDQKAPAAEGTDDSDRESDDSDDDDDSDDGFASDDGLAPGALDDDPNVSKPLAKKRRRAATAASDDDDP